MGRPARYANTTERVQAWRDRQRTRREVAEGQARYEAQRMADEVAGLWETVKAAAAAGDAGWATWLEEHPGAPSSSLVSEVTRRIREQPTPAA